MRHFTVDEANAMLPMLIPVLEDMRGLHERFQQAARSVVEIRAVAEQNGHRSKENLDRPVEDLDTIRTQMEERLAYLQGIGVVVKDIENGLIDFPGRMFGRDVYLCWRLGEDRVAFWHDVDTGFAGRQPL